MELENSGSTPWRQQTHHPSQPRSTVHDSDVTSSFRFYTVTGRGRPCTFGHRASAGLLKLLVGWPAAIRTARPAGPWPGPGPGPGGQRSLDSAIAPDRYSAPAERVDLSSVLVAKVSFGYMPVLLTDY